MLLSQISQLKEEANVKILNIWDGKGSGISIDLAGYESALR
jgi:hypothetical protein